jgi:hypothetical protein
VLAILLIYVKPAYGSWVFFIALAGWIAGWLYTFEKAKHKSWFFLALILPVLFIWFTLQLTFVQNWIASTVSDKLSDNLKAKVSIQHIKYSFFDKMDLKGLLIEDRQKDTLLYAGSAKVNITDWFFLKTKATLKYVSLTDAVVNMQRTDSVWNYQFLIDYFSSPKKTTAKKSTIEFDIKILQLQNIQFNKIDKWIGKDLTVAVKKLDLFADDITIAKKQISLKTLTLDEPIFSQYDYPGNIEKLNLPKDTSHAEAKTTAYRWNNAGWVFNVKNIHINNGVFNNQKETERAPYTDRFDGAHLRFTNITGDFKNIHFEKDTLTADINLATKERSGFEVKKLKAAFKFTPEIMEFKQLDLVTNKSRLGNYYAMHYRSFSKDMGDFIHSVSVEGNFVNSELNSDDLAFFAPELKQWKRIFQMKGLAKGTIDNLSTKKMFIKSGNSFVDGDIALKGLPDIKNTFIDFRANELQTTFADLTAIIPSLKTVQQPNLAKLGNISYKGNYTGFINDFVAFGTIKTNLGVVMGDINMKLPENKPAVYLGKISTEGFKLGEFINTNQIGSIVFNGKLNGIGFKPKEVKANFDGNIRSIDFAGYTYQNITIKGDIGKNLFNGAASINDPNLMLNDLKGSIDFSGPQPQFHFDADLAKADLKKLKLTLDDFVLNGHFNLDFTGSNIDNFLGTAKIYNAGLLHNAIPLSFDSLILQSSIMNDSKILTLQSNNVEAEVDGKFTIKELPDAFKVFLSRYYPSYIKKPVYTVSDQDFSFLIKTKEVDSYIQLLDPKLKGFNNTIIEGSLKLKENQFNVNATVPEFSYNGKIFNNIRLESKGTLDTLVAKIDVDDVQINDSLHLPATNLVFSSHNDLTDISIKTSASKTISSASINAQVQTMPDGVKIHFSPSSFIINDKKWELEKDGELVLSKSQVSASEVKFIQGTQEINISTVPSEIGNTNDIVVKLKKVSIDDLLPLVLKKPRLEGLLSGTARITDPFGKPYIEYDTQVEAFVLDADSIGVVNAAGTYAATTGILNFKVAADNKENLFNIEGSYNTKDSTGNQADIAIVSKRLDLKLLNNYLNGIFSDIKGVVNTSDLKVTGNSKHLSITGTANITEGSLKVNYTQCRYRFKNETVIFNPDEIDFGTITLTDTLNNTASLSGKMYHRFFNDISFDNIKLETNKMLVLNTTKKDNNQFYGKVIGKAMLILNGSAENITMNISGEPSRTDSSHIYLLSGSSVESGVVDYIDFIQFGSKMEDYYKGRSSGNIVVNMSLTANPSCKIDVILDESTGDIIKGEGSGLLKIRVGNKEPLSINGRYDISKGEYTFNFQTFLKKYFTVNSGSITWSGDPYKAQIDIIAEYLASNVDFSNISSTIGTTSRSFNKKGDLRVLAHLTETLLKPAIDFEFKLPESSPLRSDFFIVKRLQQFREDKNDLNKQVTSLLLFNTFINNSQGFLTASSGYNVLSSTIGGVVSNAISGFFNNFLKKYIKNTSLYFDLNTSLGGSAIDLQANVAQLQAAAKSGFIFTLLNGRLIISAGVNVDYNNPYITYNRNNNVLVTPDITAEFLITKDGRVRVVGFNRTNYDLVGQRNKTGVNLSYRKDFDKLTQLFTADEEKKRIKALNKAKQAE